MSRLTAKGEAIRIRKGRYWKGSRTRIGMPLPRPLDVAMRSPVRALDRPVCQLRTALDSPPKSQRSNSSPFLGESHH